MLDGFSQIYDAVRITTGVDARFEFDCTFLNYWFIAFQSEDIPVNLSTSVNSF